MPKSRNSTIFDTVQMRAPEKNSFDLSHNNILSLDMGYLVPTLCMEILPGETHHIGHENFLRFLPMVSPVMHQINVKTYDFFVPLRLLWSEFPDWLAGESVVEAPYVTGLIETTWSTGSMADYLGINPCPDAFTTQKVSPFAIAAYALIYDEWFRDQNLQTQKQFIPLTAGDNTTNYIGMLAGDPFKKAWEHDYFTSCLPFAQKGNPVTLPLVENTQTEIEVKAWEGSPASFPIFVNASTLSTLSTPDGLVAAAANVQRDGSTTALSYDPKGTLYVDLNAEAVNINTLRRAFRLQEWLERNARGGTRYIEHIYAHFGQKSRDSRLQRPEYIGSSTQVVRVSEVLSTAQTIDQSSNDVPVGLMAGHGISMGGGNVNTFKTDEHGIIISIMCVIPKTTYYQGMHRMHQRFDPLDYAYPTFANIGEQEVLVKEIRNNEGTEEELNETFGYIPRYSEYKFMHNRIAGDMRDSLEFWHLARKWESTDIPALNLEFIECSPDKRIFAVTDPDAHSIIAQVFHNIKSVRPLPRYGIPTI